MRLELRRFAPVFLKPDRAVRSHILVAGLQGRWEQALAQLILAGQDQPDALPLLTLWLTEAEAAAFTAWHAARPELALVVEFVVLDQVAAVPAAWRDAHPPPQLAVVLQADAEAVAMALALRRPGNGFGTEAAPVLVRQSTEDFLLARLDRRSRC